MAAQQQVAVRPGLWLPALLPPRWRRPALLVRASMALGCAALAPFLGQLEALVWLVGLISVGLLASQVVKTHRQIGTVLFGVEAILWAAAVNETGRSMSPLLPYLIAPLFAVGFSASVPGAFAVAGAASVGVIAAAAFGPDPRLTAAYSAAITQFLVTALLVGLIAAWLRSLRVRARLDATPYAEAHRLLGQLRTVAVRLPGSLDPVTLGSSLLDDVAAQTGSVFAESAVLINAGGERLVPLAHHGGERLTWDTSLQSPGPLADMWAARELQVHHNRMPVPAGVADATGPAGTDGPPPNGRRSGTLLVVPLEVGGRLLGALVLESDEITEYPPEMLASLKVTADEAALRLAAAMMFDEIREVATTEERRRLSREIHDGVAQEVASLGYELDELVTVAHELGDDRYASGMSGLRERITRLLAELRISIYDLRSEADRYGGLGAALSEYVRTIGTTSSLTVHVSLDEAPTRLPAHAEAGLLRIAQQAISNARRHAQAANLWVSCRVAPPNAHIVIEDDGRGLIPTQGDGFGLGIMRERADQLGASLTIRSGDPRGTRIEVSIGPPPRPARPAKTSTDRTDQIRGRHADHRALG